MHKEVQKKIDKLLAVKAPKPLPKPYHPIRVGRRHGVHAYAVCVHACVHVCMCVCMRVCVHGNPIWPVLIRGGDHEDHYDICVRVCKMKDRR